MSASSQSGGAQTGHRNRLAAESSPYLLQHAGNPVDWWAWSPEAFKEARRREVPIFLSIGYSTCYWCHVMERESFESHDIARLMNERFVCIKVDREERPDVDDLYMAATQAMTGRGGWPMSIFLEPQTLRPFWCGTYFPAEPKFSGVPTFPQVMEAISKAWNERRDEVMQQAEELGGAVLERLGAHAADREPAPVGRRQIGSAISTLVNQHDRTHGGFGSSGPKFPQPVYLDLLLAGRGLVTEDETRRAIDAVLRHTLDRMAVGGMFDQIGGGFHRYSVDERWLVPHFEKMLYDNALLTSVYARAARAYDDSFYAAVAGRTVEYAFREMRSEEGAFFSAQDAEVDGREGRNYVWRPEQVRAALGDDDAAFVLDVFGLNEGPNFRDPHHPDDAPVNVLRLADRPERIAARRGESESAFGERLARVSEAMLRVRERRDAPATDDKVITGWNGLMIEALATGARLLDRPEWQDAARRCADFVLTRLSDGKGGLLRSRRGDREGPPAVLEDYALLIQGLAALARADTDDRRWLDEAVRLTGVVEDRFGDGRGGLFDTTADRNDLFIRLRNEYDGAVPCGNSVMANALLDLAELTADERFAGRAAALLASLSRFLASTPLGAANSTRALLRLLSRHPAIASATFPEDSATDELDEAGADEGSDGSPVEIFATKDRVTVSADGPAGFVLKVRIREGYHLYAPPGAGGEGGEGEADASPPQIPLRVGVINGSGVRVYADYPAGAAMPGEEGLRVYTGEFDLPVIVERTDDAWSGRPLLAVAFQACREDACLAPRTVELDIALDRG